MAGRFTEPWRNQCRKVGGRFYVCVRGTTTTKVQGAGRRGSRLTDRMGMVVKRLVGSRDSDSVSTPSYLPISTIISQQQQPGNRAFGGREPSQLRALSKPGHRSPDSAVNGVDFPPLVAPQPTGEREHPASKQAARKAGREAGRQAGRQAHAHR